jgi:hypothetical protein
MQSDDCMNTSRNIGKVRTYELFEIGFKQALRALDTVVGRPTIVDIP